MAETRPIYEIADDIFKTWEKVNYGAVPYLEAMKHLNAITDSYYEESARTVVCYFLSNAGTWRGPDARRIKNELKEMVK